MISRSDGDLDRDGTNDLIAGFIGDWRSPDLFAGHAYWVPGSELFEQ